MNITHMALQICRFLNKINKESQEKNIAIQYGLELLLDTIVKIFFIQVMGCLIDKGLETFLILFIFCILRSQAGGWHSQSEGGCLLAMACICIISLIGADFWKINIFWLCIIFLSVMFIVLLKVPNTANIKYFTKKNKVKKKMNSAVILSVFVLIARLNPEIRELVIYPIVLEALSLIPKNKQNTKRGIEG